MRLQIVHSIGMSFFLLLPLAGSGAESTLLPLTTRQQTIRPLAIPPGTLQIAPSNVPLYAVYGYSSWQWGPGENADQKLNLMPSDYAGATNVARLLSFFSMSDVHITDKESPAQVTYYGWSAPFNGTGKKDLYSQTYSPVLLSTPHVLDAAIKTANALHRQTPFDFGIFLGDVVNSSQFNELRWFIDILDGKYITPSSGAHLGADSIGYQKHFQAVGLDRSIPWYQVIGNHDQFWMGVAYPTDKLLNAMVGSNVLNMGANLFAVNATEATGVYVGVVDGTTPYGNIIKGGPTNLFDTPPTVVADTNRHLLTTSYSSTTNFMSEFYNTISLPMGHGFSQTNIESNSACYSFVPKANIPIKVIVLDDTVKTNIPNMSLAYCGSGCIDAARYAWLTNELQIGQDLNQLMIVATHIPINPQTDITNTTSLPQFLPPPYSYQNDAQLIATLHDYPNLILLIAGHRHQNAVTPQPSPDPAHPENGFWEVEVPSLRDFPQQFRNFDIRRNGDNTVSILATDVDPMFQDGSPAADSRGYAIGAARIFGNFPLADVTSHACNAELIKPLSPVMQTRIAGCGAPLDHPVSIGRDGTGVTIGFTGKLMSADAIVGPWSEVLGATNPYPAASSGTKFYRSAE